MAKIPSVSRDLTLALVVQGFAVLLAASSLDMGQLMLATAGTSIAYWVGVMLVILRRSKTLTEGDHLFIRFGLIPILVIGIPAFFCVWAFKGAL
jgi:hypothetical protein